MRTPRTTDSVASLSWRRARDAVLGYMRTKLDRWSPILIPLVVFIFAVALPLLEGLGLLLEVMDGRRVSCTRRAAHRGHVAEHPDTVRRQHGPFQAARFFAVAQEGTGGAYSLDEVGS